MTHKFNLQPGLHLSTSNCPSASPRVCLRGILSIKFPNWTSNWSFSPNLYHSLLLVKSNFIFPVAQAKNLGDTLDSSASPTYTLLPHLTQQRILTTPASKLSRPQPLLTPPPLLFWPKPPLHLARLLQWPLKWSPCLFLWILNTVTTGILGKFKSALITLPLKNL